MKIETLKQAQELVGKTVWGVLESGEGKPRDYSIQEFKFLGFRSLDVHSSVVMAMLEGADGKKHDIPIDSIFDKKGDADSELLRIAETNATLYANYAALLRGEG